MKLDIDDPIQLSSSQDLDYLILNIINPEFIISRDSKKMIQAGKIKLKEIPPQIDIGNSYIPKIL